MMADIRALNYQITLSSKEFHLVKEALELRAHHLGPEQMTEAAHNLLAQFRDAYTSFDNAHMYPGAS